MMVIIIIIITLSLKLSSKVFYKNFQEIRSKTNTPKLQNINLDNGPPEFFHEPSVQNDKT